MSTAHRDPEVGEHGPAPAPEDSESRRAKAAALAAVSVLAILGASALASSGWLSDAETAPVVGPREVIPIERMPGHLEATARDALESHASLGTARVVALDSRWSEVPPSAAGDVSAMYVVFGEEQRHTWKVFLGEPTDPASDPCGHDTPEDHCDVTRAPDGTTSIMTVAAARRSPRLGPGRFVAIDASTMADEHLPDLRVERNVRVIRPDGSMTSVTEQVFGPRTTDLDEIFNSPVSDLQAVADDESLVLPTDTD